MKQRGEGTTFDFRALLKKQNRTRLAVVLGGAAMLLLLLSELLPATPPAEPSAASASQASAYREQLEAQLQDLIGQIDGVAVVCDGGGDVRVAARITELVRALLDISSTRICVEQRRP